VSKSPHPFRGEGQGEGESLGRDRKLLGYAKRLRTGQTPIEHKLWHALRAKRFGGAKFRRQVVIGRYIVDFACRIPRMLIIEVDGDSHAFQRGYDEERTAFLESRGYRVLRFSNQDLGANLEGVLMTIGSALGLPLSPTLSPEGERETGAACRC